MSSIIVINNNQEQKKPLKKYPSKKKNIRRISVDKKSPKKIGENILERKFFSDETIETEKEKYIDNLFNENKDNKNGYYSNEEDIIRNNGKETFNKDINNLGNKELFIQLLKFANDLYQKKYIDESQKKILKQLIIMYIK